MNWILLIIAGILEIIWAVGIKYSEGFTKVIPSVVTIFCMILSMGLLSYASRSLPLGTAYAVWTGIGAVGTAIAGIYLFNEPKDLPRIICISFIILGIIGLKFLKE